jgi:hypothetical protein
LSKRTRRVGESLIAATAVVAIGVSASVPETPASTRSATSTIELAAVVTPGTATNPDATGIDKFYGVDWNAAYGPTVVATFHLLRDQIQVDAIDEALKTNPEPNVVLTSGIGSGND